MPKEEVGASEEVKPERTSGRKASEKKVTSKDVSRIKAAQKELDVSIRSRWPGQLIVTEDQVPSGNRYVFPHGGSVVEVAAEDVETLLARQRKSGCCGTGQVEHFFELA
jgi:hypothetical protein